MMLIKRLTYIDMLIQKSTYRKSTSGCCFNLGFGMISWFGRKQSCVALSTAEVEYVAACSASCKVVWLQKLLLDLFDLKLETTCILCDN